MPPSHPHRPPPPRRRHHHHRHHHHGGRRGSPVIVILVAILLVVCAIALKFRDKDPAPDKPDNTLSSSVSTTQAAPKPTDEPTTGEPTTQPTTEPAVRLEATATIAATGDMLMHLPCIRPAQTANGDYNFEHYFTYLQDYIARADYAVANLETTLCSEDNGYEYHGYPNFNCPDGIVPSLQNVGFDMLLTANNHCYDTNSVGYHRTQQVLREYGMDYTGSFSDPEQPKYLLKDINGIRIGMLCYTYEDSSDPNVVAPNGRPMTDSDEVLINAFNVQELDTFYRTVDSQIEQMKVEGAEAVVMYIHWGAEYQLKQNATQEAIAQKLCDLGVDVIVGGHPHVIQPMDLLTSTENPEHKTLCLYSTGNALSNQRRNLMRLDTGHTEDGIVFSFTFSKYSDGTVRVEAAEVLPTWINLYTSNATGKKVYDVLPLDMEIEDWKTQMNLSDSTLKEAHASYERTMAIVGEGLAEIQEYLNTLPEIE